MRRKGLLLAAIISLVTASPAAAEVYRVTTTADAAGSCVTTPAACAGIRQALNSAAQSSGADTVVIPAGTYQLTLGALAIADDPGGVSIIGAGARDTTIVANTDGTARVFEIDGMQATIAHLTLRGGTATAGRGFFGGNLWAIHGDVLLDHVRSTGGTAYSGGGIANRNGTMRIESSLVDHNVASLGGGDGGGIINFGGDNLGSATLTIRSSTIAFNTANLVGGIIQYGSPQDALTLDGVTIARNGTGSRGGAGGVSIDAGTGVTRGSLLAGNVGGPNCGPVALTSQGGNVDDGTSCAFGDPTDRSGAAADLEPDLRDAGGETDVLPFGASSAALNVGGACAALDQTGAARPQGGACDAGAWEAPAVPPTPPPVVLPAVRALPAVTPIVTPVLTQVLPVLNTSVGAVPMGTVLIKVNGVFVPLKPGVVPNGAELDVKRGRVTITTSSGEVATFYAGRFTISQRGGLTTLTLSEPLDCRTAKGKAAAAAAKPKTRKLWGDGKGRFRTKGSYSAATVRGTRWLVQDTCTTTLTRVAQGVVSVRDTVKKKTVTLRKGKSYVARAKKR